MGWARTLGHRLSFSSFEVNSQITAAAVIASKLASTVILDKSFGILGGAFHAKHALDVWTIVILYPFDLLIEQGIKFSTHVNSHDIGWIAH